MMLDYEYAVRDVVDTGRREGVSDSTIREGLQAVKDDTCDPLRKVVITRVMNDMVGNTVLKFKEGGSS